jgi:hypothetical protein
MEKQSIADTLLQVVQQAFEQQVNDSDSATLLTLAYSTDP